MIEHTILLIVKEDDISGMRRVPSARPTMSGLEPAGAVTYYCELGDYPVFDISALITAPADEACTPVHMTIEAIPLPELVTSNITDLSLGHLNNIAISSSVYIAAVLRHIESSTKEYHNDYNQSGNYGTDRCRVEKSF